MVTLRQPLKNENLLVPLIGLSGVQFGVPRSVIIRVINKIRGRPICLITSMITDRTGRHEVLLPINHNFNEICYI